jgi:hypothetical protein
MSDHGEEDVARAMRAVQTAYDDFQALRASRPSKTPTSLSNAGRALDKLRCNLNLLNTTEALSIFRGFTLKEANNSVEIPLSDALVHDMEAIASHFRFMNPVDSAETPGDLNEQECRNIEDLVIRYDITVFSVLTQHNACVRDDLAQDIHLADRSQIDFGFAHGPGPRDAGKNDGDKSVSFGLSEL